MKKYELTKETKSMVGQTLYRIKALRDFSDVGKGDLGGFIKSEENLSHEGDCWVYDEACVFDKAKVYEDAKVCEYAVIYEKASVYGNAFIYRKAEIGGDAKLEDGVVG